MTITPREDEGHASELARRKIVRHLRQAPLLIESLTDDSETDEEPDRRKMRMRALKSGKIRTSDSTVVKRITWPHEFLYTNLEENLSSTCTYQCPNL